MLAAVTLPITAVASIYGMNVIVNDSTHWEHLVLVLSRWLPSAGCCCAGRNARAGGDGRVSPPAGSLRRGGPVVTAEVRTRALIILGLSGLAVTQPLLDLFGQEPGVLRRRQLQPGQIVSSRC